MLITFFNLDHTAKHTLCSDKHVYVQMCCFGSVVWLGLLFRIYRVLTFWQRQPKQNPFNRQCSFINTPDHQLQNMRDQSLAYILQYQYIRCLFVGRHFQWAFPTKMPLIRPQHMIPFGVIMTLDVQALLFVRCSLKHPFQTTSCLTADYELLRIKPDHCTVFALTQHPPHFAFIHRQVPGTFSTVPHLQDFYYGCDCD